MQGTNGIVLIHLVNLFKVKKVIILLVFITGITACRKDAGTGADAAGSGIYYIKFKANGVEKKYSFSGKLASNYIDSSIVVSAKKIYTYSLVGANSSGHSFTIGLYNESPLKAPATFLESAYIYNTMATVVFAFNENLASTAAMSIGLVVPFPALFAYPQYDNLPRNGKATITEYTAHTIKGTFSGIVYQTVNNEALIDASKKTVITEGAFYLGIQ